MSRLSRVAKSVSLTSVLHICLLILFITPVLTCKARRPGGRSETLGDDNASAPVDPKAAAEAVKVATACGQGSKFFRGIGAQVRIDFLPNGEAPNVEPEQLVQPEWDEEANFQNGKWVLSSPVYGSPNKAECLRSSTVLSTEQLVAALGCSNEDPCSEPTDVCDGDRCLSNAGEIDFERPTVAFNNQDGKATAGSAAVALTDSIAAPGGIQCRNAERGWVLTNANGTTIGKAVDSSEHCTALAKTQTTTLVCGWTGSSLQPHRTSDGQFVGTSASTGAKSIATCASMIATENAGVVCSWTGRGYEPFASTGQPRMIGAPGTAADIELCAEKAKSFAKDRICDWDGNGIRIYNVVTGRFDKELGSFRMYEACSGAIRLTDTPAKKASYLAELKSAIVAPGSSAAPSDASLGLAESPKWSWEDCAQSNRNDHLVKLSAGSLICDPSRIDTIYSWGPKAKITWLEGQKWTGRTTRDGKYAPIYATQSSFATFGYGDYAIRFKISRNSRFRYFDGAAAAANVCGQLSSSEIEDTIAVVYWKNMFYTGVDYILCGMGPIHSWSWGTTPHNDQMRREVSWIANHSYREYELYVKNSDGVDKVYPNQLDGHSFSKEIWEARYLLQSVAANNERDHYHYHPRSQAGTENPETHHKPRSCTHINCEGAPVVAVGGGGQQPVKPPPPPPQPEKVLLINTNLQIQTVPAAFLPKQFLQVFSTTKGFRVEVNCRMAMDFRVGPNCYNMRSISPNSDDLWEYSGDIGCYQITVGASNSTLCNLKGYYLK